MKKTGDSSAENDEKNHIATSRFLLKTNAELLDKWVKVVNRRDWIPSSTAVLSEKHFEEEYISRGKKCNLKWKCNPIPTIHSEQSLNDRISDFST